MSAIFIRDENPYLLNSYKIKCHFISFLATRLFLIQIWKLMDKQNRRNQNTFTYSETTKYIDFYYKQLQMSDNRLSTNKLIENNSLIFFLSKIENALRYSCITNTVQVSQNCLCDCTNRTLYI